MPRIVNVTEHHWRLASKNHNDTGSLYHFYRTLFAAIGEEINVSLHDMINQCEIKRLDSGRKFSLRIGTYTSQVFTSRNVNVTEKQEEFSFLLKGLPQRISASQHK